MSDDDIVRDMLRRVREAHPEFPPEKLTRIEMDIRREWGGARHYVSAGRDERLAAMKAELAEGRPREEVLKKYGVSERTMYRLLNRRR